MGACLGVGAVSCTKSTGLLALLWFVYIPGGEEGDTNKLGSSN